MKTFANIAVALPAGEPFELVWLHGIKPAFQEMAVLGTRLNTSLSATALRNQVRATLANNDCLLADLTGNNPAVLYYLGVAEALGKPVILVARNAETVVFHINQPILAYADEPSLLRTQLISRLNQNHSEAPAPVTAPQPVADNPETARFYEIFGDILQQHGYQNHGEIKCENESTFLLIEQDMELALVQDLSRRAKERGLRLKLL
ncbi:MAG: hypothetical protein K0Q55_573 [Verrucomicrobia bacterium]|jgi:hypothetical protein|nr:hypothetical protein [Verrucomicrobiota bacterium]